MKRVPGSIEKCFFFKIYDFVKHTKCAMESIASPTSVGTTSGRQPSATRATALSPA